MPLRSCRGRWPAFSDRNGSSMPTSTIKPTASAVCRTHACAATVRAEGPGPIIVPILTIAAHANRQQQARACGGRHGNRGKRYHRGRHTPDACMLRPSCAHAVLHVENRALRYVRWYAHDHSKACTMMTQKANALGKALDACVHRPCCPHAMLRGGQASAQYFVPGPAHMERASALSEKRGAQQQLFMCCFRPEALLSRRVTRTLVREAPATGRAPQQRSPTGPPPIRIAHDRAPPPPPPARSKGIEKAPTPSGCSQATP